MKKKLISITLACSLLAGSCIPVLADEKDNRIAELESQIVDLQNTIDELEEKLAAAESKASDLYL